MYSISDYGAMIGDRARIDAVVAALRRVVTPESVVVDIGTGTGIIALLACQLGARRVYAIEPDDAIEVAREAAAANGYADRMECLQAVSTAVTLPEPADIIISDIGGVLPWLGHHLPAIIDARSRLLRPGGALIPSRDTVWMALVETEAAYRRSADPWATNPYGLDLTSGGRFVLNSWWQVSVAAEQLLTPVQRTVTLDYMQIADTDLNAAVEFNVVRAGNCHGVCVGIERVLVDDIGFSNAPDSPTRLPSGTIYRPAFFPWTSPVTVAPGDTVSVALRAVLSGDDYVWSWTSEVRTAGGGTKARFEQSTFFGVPLSPARLQHRSAAYQPVLNDEGAAARVVLELMRDSTPLGRIADRITEQFPARFHLRRLALAFVADLSERYAR